MHLFTANCFLHSLLSAFKFLLSLIPSHYLTYLVPQPSLQSNSIFLNLSLLLASLTKSLQPLNSLTLSNPFLIISTLALVSIFPVFWLSPEKSTLTQLKWCFKFSVAPGKPQMEQAAKILGIKFCKVSNTWNFYYLPDDFQFGQLCQEMLPVPSFKLES